MPGTAELDFSTTDGSVSAVIRPQHWEGAGWQLDAEPGSYAADNDFGGSNISNDPATPNQLTGTLDPTVLCDCSYLTWGSWNASIDANGTTYGPDSGYWIAGKLSDVADLPVSGVATYGGTAVGTVNDAGTITTGVTGQFLAVVDFGSGMGSVQISNFAGRSFGDSNLDINNSSMLGWGFAGQLSDGAELNGQYHAGFASDGSDPAAALIGTFSAEDFGSDWSASGIIGGVKE